MKNIQGVGRYSDINSVKNELHGATQTHKSHPLENGGHTVCMDYKQKVPKFARHEVLLQLFHTKYPLGKGGHTVWMDYKQKKSNFAQNN